MIIKFIAGKKMLCVALAATAITPAAVTHVVDRHVAKKAVAKAVAQVKRERPAFHTKREAIVATDFHAPPVLAEAAAACVPYAPLTGEGFAGGGGGSSSGFVGIGGGAIGIGNTPAPGGVVTSPIPEPATWYMMISGLGVIGGKMRTKRKAKGDHPAEPAPILPYSSAVRTEARLRGISEEQAYGIVKRHAAKRRAQGGIRGVNLYK